MHACMYVDWCTFLWPSAYIFNKYFFKQRQYFWGDRSEKISLRNHYFTRSHRRVYCEIPIYICIGITETWLVPHFIYSVNFSPRDLLIFQTAPSKRRDDFHEKISQKPCRSHLYVLLLSLRSFLTNSVACFFMQTSRNDKAYELYKKALPRLARRCLHDFREGLLSTCDKFIASSFPCQVHSQFPFSFSLTSSFQLERGNLCL